MNPTLTESDSSSSVAQGRAALDGARLELAYTLAGLARADLGDELAERLTERLEFLNRLLQQALADWPP